MISNSKKVQKAAPPATNRLPITDDFKLRHYGSSKLHLRKSVQHYMQLLICLSSKGILIKHQIKHRALGNRKQGQGRNNSENRRNPCNP